MENMNREICDYYTPLGKGKKQCKYYNGKVDYRYELNRCRYHCSILESKSMMKDGQVLERRRGALRRK